ncbi:hypothetical protein K458DRAFT_435592 [Lentithecium fluviatile CBS 122367]|uniref:Uncharacterized protein n=1 Tax=Lentithecium fluviatile CBS 122367 TaxID=1168545 RepID=A0A6G1IKI1_9PLEO|nr:hypothetical protein K458DRAFT_435592 [Lentithecium fluviatile CBS 122367]
MLLQTYLKKHLEGPLKPPFQYIHLLSSTNCQTSAYDPPVSHASRRLLCAKHTLPKSLSLLKPRHPALTRTAPSVYRPNKSLYINPQSPRTIQQYNTPSQPTPQQQCQPLTILHRHVHLRMPRFPHHRHHRKPNHRKYHDHNLPSLLPLSRGPPYRGLPDASS